MVWDDMGWYGMVGGWLGDGYGMVWDGMGWSGDGQGMVRGWLRDGMGWYGIERIGFIVLFEKT